MYTCTLLHEYFDSKIKQNNFDAYLLKKNLNYSDVYACNSILQLTNLNELEFNTYQLKELML